MFGFGKRHGRGMGNGVERKHRNRRHNSGCRGKMSLDNGEEGNRYMVRCNPDKQLMEMGLHLGAIVTVRKNDQDDPNMVIAVGESRFIVPRETAKQIIVK